MRRWTGIDRRAVCVEIHGRCHKLVFARRTRDVAPSIVWRKEIPGVASAVVLIRPIVNAVVGTPAIPCRTHVDWRASLVVDIEFIRRQAAACIDSRARVVAHLLAAPVAGIAVVDGIAMEAISVKRVVGIA